MRGTFFASFVFLFPLISGCSSKRDISTSSSITNFLGMEFELIQPGSMVVGRLEPQCPPYPDTRDVDEGDKWTEEDFIRCRELAEKDYRPGFLVNLEEAYFIGRYEVTQKQWVAVMDYNPSIFQGDMATGNTDHFPVDNVSWEEVQEFIVKLNSLDTSATYRLPTEFEWEFAARAGATDLLSWVETRKQAWIQRTDKGSTQTVGQMEPNAWGLYDMLGNVWEWVNDYHNGAVLPDSIPPLTGEVHVLKGGSFTSDVVNASYFFHGGGPGNGFDVGFRIIREVEQ